MKEKIASLKEEMLVNDKGQNALQHTGLVDG